MSYQVSTAFNSFMNNFVNLDANDTREGRKSRGTNKIFKIKQDDKVYEREWKQISFSNRSGALLDFVAEFYSNYRKSNILWSRQKMITLMSRMKKRYNRTPSFNKIFGV